MNLSIFNTANLFDAATNLFQQLGIKLNSNTAEPLPIKDLLKQHYKENETFESISKTYFIGIIDNTVFQATGMVDVKYAYKEALQQGDKNYDGLMLFALELSKQPTRAEISDLTRTFNRISQKMPVALLLKYASFPSERTGGEAEACFSIALSERFKYKQNWRQGEKAGKVIILRDIHTENTHAGHERILLGLVKPIGVTNYDQLHQHWLQVLDVNILNKKFFQDLANWYFWAMENVSFPDDLEKKKDIRNATNLIRLITRVVFIWFIKEKSLVPNALFNKAHLDKILKDFNKSKKSQNYYHAILQNLFFGTLNQKMDERKFAKEGDINTNRVEFGVKNLFRYADLFNIPEKEAMQLFKDVPFLNGGLFDCLDKPNEDGKVVYVDGFSRNPKKQASVPDYIFFGEEREVDLNEIFATKNKKYKSRGLINLLESYKFTVAENTPIEEEIALDPELLGKVFENLLASYNPETQTNARKQTGSFYTPREIVNYMVDESLLEYIKQNCLNHRLKGLNDGTDFKTIELLNQRNPEISKISDSDFELRLRDLLSYSETPNPFDETETKALIEAINNCKILDPACGSGAYPMGILHKMVHLLQKLDVDNKHWKALQRQKAMEETETAFNIGDKEERGKRLNEINDVFENNASDYGRKLYLIENCIYGIDIQPIAVQISKLRFFISLIIDQNKQENKENFGIRSLPNLETKFVAANTLIGLDIPTNDLFAENNPIKKLENDLKNVRHEYFAASNRKEKLRLQKEDKNLRKQISELIKDQLIKKGDSDIVELKQIIELEKGNLKQLEKSKEDVEIIKINDIFGEIIQTKIDKKAIKLKAQKDRISHYEKDLQIKELATNKDAIAKVAEQIASFDPYDQNTFAPWFDPEWMFGLTNGFDIILGNPPYVSANNMSIHDRNYFNASTQYKTLKGKWDLYVAFTEKALVSLKANGIFTFIIPFGFLNQPFAETLRKFVLKNFKLLSIVDLHNNKIFESATVPSCIPLIQKKQSKEHKVNISEFKNNQFLIKYQIDIQKYAEGNQHMFRTEDLTLKSGLLEKIKGSGEFLENYFYTSTGAEIHGKETRAIDGTTISGKSKFDVLHNQYAKGFKPYIEGSAIQKSKEGRYSFPLIDTWLDYSKPEEMRSQKFNQLFDSEKIIIRRSSGLLRILAIYDTQKIYTSEKCIIIISKTDLPRNHSQYKKSSEIDLKYLLAIVNSRLIDFYYESVYGGFIDVYPNNLKELPIKIADKSVRDVFISIVNCLLALKKSKDHFPHAQFLDRLIDAMVYELYLPEEIKAGGAEVLKHLSNLPELKEGQDDKNLKIIEKVYKELSDPNRPISAALLKLLTIEEVNIIEGRK